MGVFIEGSASTDLQTSVWPAVELDDRRSVDSENLVYPSSSFITSNPSKSADSISNKIDSFDQAAPSFATEPHRRLVELSPPLLVELPSLEVQNLQPSYLVENYGHRRQSHLIALGDDDRLPTGALLSREKNYDSTNQRFSPTASRHDSIEELRSINVVSSNSDLITSSGAHYNLIGIITINVAIFACIFAFVAIETLLVLFTFQNYKWGVYQNGGLLAAMGVEVVAMMLLVMPIAKRGVEDRQVLMGSMIFMFLSMFIGWIPFWDRIPAWCFLIMMLVFFAPGFGYAQVLCYTLYSKVLGSGNHGLEVGFQTSITSLARIASPIIATMLFTLQAPSGRFVFITVTALLLLPIMLIYVTWRHLVPFKTQFPVRVG